MKTSYKNENYGQSLNLPELNDLFAESRHTEKALVKGMRQNAIYFGIAGAATAAFAYAAINPEAVIEGFNFVTGLIGMSPIPANDVAKEGLTSAATIGAFTSAGAAAVTLMDMAGKFAKLIHATNQTRAFRKDIERIFNKSVYDLPPSAHYEPLNP